MLIKQKFEEIKDRYGDVASFAIWAKVGDKPKSNIGDMSVFDIEKNPALLDIINVNVVMVGLNFARPKDGQTLTEKFKNFHDSNPRGQDYKIRFVFEGTNYYGAYMTDIIKDFVMLDSADVKKYLKNNPDYLASNVKAFQEELVEIGADKPFVLAFGEDVYRILHDNLDPRLYSKLVKLTHYSHQISKEKYREKVHGQLGL